MVDFLRTIWERTSALGRMVFIGACVLILVLVIGLFFWSSRTDYQPLFTDMAEQDMSAVAAALDKQKVHYEIAPDGKTILVDKNAVYKTRMKLMGDGVSLQGGVGLELFNNAEFGMTEFAQRVNYQRALQGELARTIMGFDEVQNARVHLVLPEGGLLRRRGTTAKASVWVTLRGNSVLSPEQVSGVQRLVSASVPEIEPSTVTVLNHKGVALSTNNQYGDGFYAGNANLQLKKEVETYFSGKIADVLDETLGVGKAAIAVDVTLDYAQVQTTKETVLPALDKQTGVVIRQRERSSGSTPVSVQPNTVNSGSAASPSVVATPSSKMVEVDYQAGKEVQQIITVPGTIKRLSVGIVMPKKLPDATMARMEQVIAMAVGLDLTRGDAIAFSTMDSITPATDDGTMPQNNANGGSNEFLLSNQQLLTIGIAALVVILVLFGAALFVRRRQVVEPSALSLAERERLLAHVKQWLKDDESSGASVNHEQ